MKSTKNRRSRQLGRAAALVLTGGTARLFADPAPVSIAPPIAMKPSASSEALGFFLFFFCSPACRVSVAPSR